MPLNYNFLTADAVADIDAATAVVENLTQQCCQNTDNHINSEATLNLDLELLDNDSNEPRNTTTTTANRKSLPIDPNCIPSIVLPKHKRTQSTPSAIVVRDPDDNTGFRFDSGVFNFDQKTPTSKTHPMIMLNVFKRDSGSQSSETELLLDRESESPLASRSSKKSSRPSSSSNRVFTVEENQIQTPKSNGQCRLSSETINSITIRISQKDESMPISQVTVQEENLNSRPHNFNFITPAKTLASRDVSTIDTPIIQTSSKKAESKEILEEFYSDEEEGEIDLDNDDINVTLSPDQFQNDYHLGQGNNKTADGLSGKIYGELLSASNAGLMSNPDYLDRYSNTFNKDENDSDLKSTEDSINIVNDNIQSPQSNKSFLSNLSSHNINSYNVKVFQQAASISPKIYSTSTLESLQLCKVDEEIKWGTWGDSDIDRDMLTFQGHNQSTNHINSDELDIKIVDNGISTIAQSHCQEIDIDERIKDSMIRPVITQPPRGKDKYDEIKKEFEENSNTNLTAQSDSDLRVEVQVVNPQKLDQLINYCQNQNQDQNQSQNSTNGPKLKKRFSTMSYGDRVIQQCKEHSDLQKCREIRRIVFNNDNESNGKSDSNLGIQQDDKAIHFLAQINKIPVGTVRVFVQKDNSGTDSDNNTKLNESGSALLDGEPISLDNIDVNTAPESESEFPQQLCARLSLLAVHPNHREQGVGKALTLAVEESLKATQTGIILNSIKVPAYIGISRFYEEVCEYEKEGEEYEVKCGGNDVNSSVIRMQNFVKRL